VPLPQVGWRTGPPAHLLSGGSRRAHWVNNLPRPSLSCLMYLIGFNSLGYGHSPVLSSWDYSHLFSHPMSEPSEICKLSF
jgi:hypothetical protein